jgi:hypothetical protein
MGTEGVPILERIAGVFSCVNLEINRTLFAEQNQSILTFLS